MDRPTDQKVESLVQTRKVPSPLPRKTATVYGLPPVLVEIVARSGIPSPLKSAATSLNTVDPNEGDDDSSKPIPGMPAPREAVSSTLLLKVVSTNDTSPVGDAVPPYPVTLAVRL